MLRRPFKFRLPNHASDKYSPDKRTTGGSVMTSRLALCATVAAAVLFSAGASAQTYEVTELVPGSAFHGVHGLGIHKAGRMFAGSVAGAALYEVDLNNGPAKIAIPTPEGMADDIAFAPDGTMDGPDFSPATSIRARATARSRSSPPACLESTRWLTARTADFTPRPCSSATPSMKSTSRASSRRA